MRKSRVRQGSTLVELLVVGAVSTVLALGLGGILINSMKVSTSVTQTSDFNNMRTLITMALSNANPAVAPCSGMITVSTSPPSPTGQDALNGVTTASPALPTGGIALSQIANGSNVLATVGQNGSIQLTSITINPVVVGSPDPTTPIPYTTNLHLAGYKIQSNGFVPNAPTLFGDIPLSVTITYNGTTSKITSCTTATGLGGSAWTSVGTQVFNQSVSPNAWVTLDLSSTPVGAATHLVMLKFYPSVSTDISISSRTNGDPTLEGGTPMDYTSNGGGVSTCEADTRTSSIQACTLMVETDSGGKVQFEERYYGPYNLVIDLVGFL